jgi:hypothetical protein
MKKNVTERHARSGHARVTAFDMQETHQRKTYVATRSVVHRRTRASSVPAAIPTEKDSARDSTPPCTTTEDAPVRRIPPMI